MRTEPAGRTRFPVGLTLAAAVGLAILVALGMWQLQRLTWKEALLARIAKLETAAPMPVATALDGAASPADLDMVRVRVDCPGLSRAAYVELFGLKDGTAGRRLISACPVASIRYRTLLVDRGFVAEDISARPGAEGPLGPVSVTGVLRAPDPPSIFTPKADPASRLWFNRDIPAMASTLGASRPAPVMLMAETASNPEFSALSPAPIPAAISNRHLEYALTWFGLAAALLGVYGALLRKHFRS
jgi:surfeit locus 1 family protein